ncbi:phosphotransferase [Candidatus Babeliales bacterium]|nr:phosphotransferase [Candidatus Babeliales bacterium]MBP9844363.1 phosphotransferase [Candidatus Babeliales bacterium]
MKRSVLLSILLCGVSLIYTLIPSVHPIDESKLCFAIEQNLGITDLTLSPSIHGGDNKVFFVKSGAFVVGLAKCYTKRSFYEVEKICQLSQSLCKILPVASVKKIFMFHDIPVVLQDFLSGQHYEYPHEKQLENIAVSMAKIHSVILQPNDLVINHKEFDYDQLLANCASFPDFELILKVYHSLDLTYLNQLPHALIHGDISASNLLFIEDEISGIIDLDHTRYAHRLTDIARAQVFFSFDAQGNLNENKVRQFVKAYQKNVELRPEELTNFYDHLKLLLIKMTLETYYYVEVIKEVSPEIFKKSSYNQSWQLLLKKLHAIQDKSSLIL